MPVTALRLPPRYRSPCLIGRGGMAEIYKATDTVLGRDVAGNLLLDGSGNVRVADFGIARAEDLESHTQTGVVLGTIGYLAPERARGEHGHGKKGKSGKKD
jgi:serine/threonine protein kinase